MASFAVQRQRRYQQQQHKQQQQQQQHYAALCVVSLIKQHFNRVDVYIDNVVYVSSTAK